VPSRALAPARPPLGVGGLGGVSEGSGARREGRKAAKGLADVEGLAEVEEAPDPLGELSRRGDAGLALARAARLGLDPPRDGPLGALPRPGAVRHGLDQRPPQHGAPLPRHAAVDLAPARAPVRGREAGEAPERLRAVEAL